MNFVIRSLTTLMLAALLVALATPAQALSYRMMDDEALLAQAQGAAVFEVVHVADPQPGDRETRYLLAFRRGLTGQATFAFEWLALPGAQTAADQYHVEGVPRLAVGEQWLLFHARRADGVLQPVQLTLGMFKQVPNGSAAAYLRTVDLDPPTSKDANARFAAPRDADAFERWIATPAAARPGMPAYLLDALVRPKYTFVMFNFGTPRPGRWFEFDAGGSVPVRAGAGGQFGTTRDVFESLRRAIAVWNDDPGSRIHMNYVGTGHASADSAINILWNDPNNQIAGSYDCSRGGVLGIGGSSATTSQTATIGGQTWTKRVRGFVVVQDGAGCAMDGGNGANGAELLTHELGHVLALAHSCGDAMSGNCDTIAKNQATMRAILHSDGRGASLGSDDRAGIAVPYPEPLAARPARVYRSGFETGGG
jgi:hypothetical protein